MYQSAWSTHINTIKPQTTFTIVVIVYYISTFIKQLTFIFPASLRPGHRTGVSYVAIDFGTTFSGYAFAFGKDDMYMNKNWGAEAGAESFKTPTCVLTKLYRGKHEFLGFGYNAQKQYAESQDGQDGSALLCLFDKFKMKLHENLSLVSRL